MNFWPENLPRDSVKCYSLVILHKIMAVMMKQLRLLNRCGSTMDAFKLCRFVGTPNVAN